jgi:hypothetical protein
MLYVSIMDNTRGDKSTWTRAELVGHWYGTPGHHSSWRNTEIESSEPGGGGQGHKPNQDSQNLLRILPAPRLPSTACLASGNTGRFRLLRRFPILWELNLYVRYMFPSTVINLYTAVIPQLFQKRSTAPAEEMYGLNNTRFQTVAL